MTLRRWSASAAYLAACLSLAVFCLGSAALAPAAAAAPKRAFGERALQTGAKGRDVRVLQVLLTRVGISTPTDGQFGPYTADRVRAWETRTGSEADGRLTRREARRLRREARGERVAYGTGGTVVAPDEAPATLVPGAKARISRDGLAVAPASAPEAVKRIIAAGNAIHSKPYRYGGGHGRWRDSGYDCSGSVSFALHGAGLLSSPLNSTGFMSWGSAGKGRWVTIYAHGGHAYMVVAGLRFDTSGRAERGSRWTTEKRSSAGFTARHPTGL